MIPESENSPNHPRGNGARRMTGVHTSVSPVSCNDPLKAAKTTSSIEKVEKKQRERKSIPFLSWNKLSSKRESAQLPYLGRPRHGLVQQAQLIQPGRENDQHSAFQSESSLICSYLSSEKVTLPYLEKREDLPETSAGRRALPKRASR